MARRARRRKAKRGTTAGKGSPAMDALVAYIRSHRKAPYREVAEAMSRAGHKVYPIMFGRAQALLGMTRKGKRKAGKGRRAGTRGPGRATRRGGRGGRPPRDGGLDQLRSILDDYAALRQERDQLREALDGIRRALGST